MRHLPYAQIQESVVAYHVHGSLDSDRCSGSAAAGLIHGFRTMRTHRIAVGPVGWLIYMVLLPAVAPMTTTVTMTIATLLPSRGFAQAERATSQIKKPLIYQFGNVVHINAVGPRPLLRALDALQEKYGWTVDYEDPQYPSESNAPANPRWRHPNAGSSRGESFSVEFNPGPTPDSRPDQNSVLTTVVNAYNEGSAVAQFELRKENRNNKDKNSEQHPRFDVVGVAAPDQQDTTHSQAPILDLPITLAKEKRTAEQTIALICQKLNEKSKIPVTVNADAGNVRWRATVTVGGREAPARALLSRTLAAMGDHLSWRLLYDPSGVSYEFNVSGSSQ